MTPKELLQNLQTYLKGLEWTAGNKIFGTNVFITSQMPANQLSQLVTPCCFIIENSQNSHAEHNNIIEVNFTLMIFVENYGQNMGESTIIGGNRIANTSKGAGILDIEDKVLQGLDEQVILNTAKITFLSKSRAKNVVMSGNNPHMTRSMNFHARTSYY
jgi:hypothetical protein